MTESVGEEPQATFYCRCPLSLATQLYTLAFERSKGKRRSVTKNELMIEAVERFVTNEGIWKLAARDRITMAEVIEKALDLYAST